MPLSNTVTLYLPETELTFHFGRSVLKDLLLFL